LSPVRGEALAICRSALRRGIIPPERRAEVEALIRSCEPDLTHPERLVEAGVLTEEELGRALRELSWKVGFGTSGSTTHLPPTLGYGATERSESGGGDGFDQFIERAEGGRYVNEGVIGRGGMGIVYRVYDRKLKRTVALKLLREGGEASPESLRRFQRGVEAAGRLSHPNIVPVYDVVLTEAFPYFTMRFVDGMNLGEMLKRGPLGTRQALSIFIKVARAIGAGHRAGIIHRDIKPSNIIIDKDGEPHVTDFGLAKDLRELTQLTAPGYVLGTPAYMSPEQADGHSDRADARSDVFGLGATLYHLVTGRPPFGPAGPQADAELVPPRAVNPAIGPDLEAIIRKALELDPEARYQSVAEMVEEVERVAAGTAERTTRSGTVRGRRLTGRYLGGRLDVLERLLERVGIVEEPFRRDVGARYLTKAVQIVRETLGERGRQALLDAVAAEHLPAGPESRRMLAYVLEDEHSWVNARLELAVLLRAALMTGRADLFRQVGFLGVADCSAWRAVCTGLVGVAGLSWLYRHITDVGKNVDMISDLWFEKAASRPGRAVLCKKYRPDHKRRLVEQFGELAPEVMRCDCEILEGALAAIPLLFGRPAANVTHLQCEKDGAENCRLLVEWDRVGPLKRTLFSLANLLPWRRRLLLRLAQLDVLIREREEELERRLAAHESELRAVMEFEASLFGSPHTRCGVPIAAAHRFSEDIGGDFYDILDLPGDKTGLLVCEANVGGFRAALATAMLKAEAAALGQLGDPARFLRELNARMRPSLARINARLAATFAVLDPKTGDLTYASVGHTPLVILHPDASAEEHGTTEEAMGASENLSALTIHLRLAPGDSLWLYTDGVLNVTNRRGERLGRERFLDFIRHSASPNLQQWAESVLERCEAFALGAPIRDDITILSARMPWPVS